MSVLIVVVDIGIVNVYVIVFFLVWMVFIFWVLFWFKVKISNMGVFILNVIGIVFVFVGGVY